MAVYTFSMLLIKSTVLLSQDLRSSLLETVIYKSLILKTLLALACIHKLAVSLFSSISPGMSSCIQFQNKMALSLFSTCSYSSVLMILLLGSHYYWRILQVSHTVVCSWFVKILDHNVWSEALGLNRQAVFPICMVWIEHEWMTHLKIWVPFYFGDRNNRIGNFLASLKKFQT